MLRLLSRRSFIVFCLSVVAAGCGVSPEEKAKQDAKEAADALEVKTRQEKYDAFNSAQTFVTNELTSPGSAKFEDYDDNLVTILSPGVYKSSGYVDSQNGFGALLRSNWVVKSHKTGDTYHLDEISVTPNGQ